MSKNKNLNPVARVSGSSFLFNALAIFINLLGLALVVMGFHKNYEEQSVALLSSGFLLMLTSTVVLILLKGRLLMNGFSRIFVGGLFIVSGLVKANDPVGFSYKLEEYFEDGALAYRIKEWFGMPDFTLEYFIQFALPLSVIICIVEIVLGVMTILGRRMKSVSILLVGMMLFFTFLTWHTANCDGSTKFLDRDTYMLNDPIAQSKLEQAKNSEEIKIVSKSNGQLIVDEMKQPQCVDDCGCFGDALKGSVGRSLTPKESMWKDLVVLYFVIWIVAASFKRGKVEEHNRKGFVFGSLLIICFFCFVFGWVFPLLFGLLALLGSIWFLNSRNKYLQTDGILVLWVIFLCSAMVAYVLAFDPIKDYRPYSVGTNLVEKMNDGQDGKYESMLVYKNKKTGEIREYNSSSDAYMNSKIWEDTKTWKYMEMTQKEIIAMRIPSITEQFNPYLPAAQITAAELKLAYVKEKMKPSKVKGLKILDLGYNSTMEIPMEEYSLDGFPESEYKILDTIMVEGPTVDEINIRDYITSANRIVVLISKRLNEANWSKMQRYKEILAMCEKRNIPMVLLVSSNPTEIAEFRKKYGFNIPVFLNDETELKAITRSNPAMLIIEKGIVKAKYPHRSTPSAEWLIKNSLK